MKNLISNKNIYFFVFGAIGGLGSAIMYGVVGLDHTITHKSGS
ncbi:hypothetical protein Thi970DRAFT_00685 [Thiorhodovibrio frisius]|uniref:Uncharacterized protein n=1 Tax=Thiorhodovibrio frisius TaxID=631362 RepID=H8YX59_9GAMM|nr:hypothetical protein Thi970DRAFT_00685 [Thiorhodovibrio frisius]WPL22700.1 hypothetical protein Thiofri_02870 [Thiorhodovibrio frisius]